MERVIKVYRLFNLLSLDVAAGAVCSSLFFVRIYKSVPSVISLISLGFTVWIVYTADRLLDIRNVSGDAMSSRYRFHQRNKKKLTNWLVIAIIIDVTLVFFMPATTIRNGIVLAIGVAIYLLFRRQLYVLKELLVAAIYTAGVVLPAWPGQSTVRGLLPVLLFFLIALINLILFSWYEKADDLRHRQNSVATIMEDCVVKNILVGLFAISFIVCGYMIYRACLFEALLFVAMTAILLVIFLCRKFFEKNDYYRLLGDAAFLLPLIYALS